MTTKPIWVRKSVRQPGGVTSATSPIVVAAAPRTTFLSLNAGCSCPTSVNLSSTSAMSLVISSNLKTAWPMVVGLVLPRLEEGVLAGLRDGRGDGGELVVGVLVEAGVGGDDEIGLERGDLIDLDAVGEVEHDGLGATELRLRPWPYGERLATEPVGHGDRHHAERQQVVLLGEPGADDPLGRSRNLGLAEGVLDRDGPVAGDGTRLVRTAGHDSDGEARGDGQETPSGPD